MKGRKNRPKRFMPRFARIERDLEAFDLVRIQEQEGFERCLDEVVS